LLIATLPNLAVDPNPPGTPSSPLPPIDRDAPADLETAVFALGCFWGPEARFGAMDGVVRTWVGYAGGTESAPTYAHLGDHLEAVKVAYDPARIGYIDLVRVFWATHDPTRTPIKRRYLKALVPQTAAQQAVAHRSFWHAAETHRPATLTTALIDDGFIRAEDHLQKYKLRQKRRLCRHVRARYPTETAFIDAPATALLNGYVGGYRDAACLDDDLPRLGLPDDAVDLLRTAVKHQHDTDRVLP